jgi:hypothetical protein
MAWMAFSSWLLLNVLMVVAPVVRVKRLAMSGLGSHASSLMPAMARHKNVHLHFTPTHASWLNQIECWFSILSRRALRGASFTSPQQVREAIDRFIAAYNENATPFEWRKKDVRNVHPRPSYANLRN